MLKPKPKDQVLRDLGETLVIPSTDESFAEFAEKLEQIMPSLVQSDRPGMVLYASSESPVANVAVYRNGKIRLTGALVGKITV